MSGEFHAEALDLVESLARGNEEYLVADRPSPGAAVAAIVGELAQAAATLGRIHGDFASAGGLGVDDPFLGYHLHRLAGRFASIAAVAVAAIAGLHPELGDEPPIITRERLLDALDEDSADWLVTALDDGVGEAVRSITPDFWLRTTVALLAGAGDGAATLGDWGSGRAREHAAAHEIEDSLGDDPLDRRATVLVADSLYQAAMIATAGVEWFLIRIEADESLHSSVDDPRGAAGRAREMPR